MSRSSTGPSSGVQSTTSVELRRKTSRPSGRRSRAASGIHRYGSAQMDAPYSESTRSNDASGSGTSSAAASTSGNSSPNSLCIARAVASCAGVGSTPTGFAPSFLSQAEKYAVPQPSSTTSSPPTSPSTASCDSGIPKIPHVISSLAHVSRARGPVCSAFTFVQISTFRGTYSGYSDELIVREPERDLALGRLGGVGAVDEVVRHRRGEVAADGARVGVDGVRRADRLAQRRDRPLPLHHERPRRRGGDEVHELAEKRLLAMLRVVALAEIARHAYELRRAHFEAAALDSPEDLAGEPAFDRVWLDEDQRPLYRHGAADAGKVLYTESEPSA